MKKLFTIAILGLILLFLQESNAQCKYPANLPPAKPELIYGDLQLCFNNSKAIYEVSPIDFSVCDYEWSGLPITAKIWNREAILNTNPTIYKSGQGTYKIYVDWGNTPEGNYMLKLVAKNVDADGNWLSSEPREVKIKVQYCGFQITPKSICLNTPVTFTPAHPNSVIKYMWDNGKAEVKPAERFFHSSTAEPYLTTYNTIGVYEVSLKITDIAGNTYVYFKKVNVIDCNSLNVDSEQSNHNHLTIYPNPSNGTLLLRSSNHEIAQLDVFDAQLRVIKSLQVDFFNQPTEVNLTELGNGIYFLKMNNKVTKMVLSK